MKEETMPVKYVLEADFQDVLLPGETRPEGRALYAILYRQGKELSREWLPDGTEAEDPGPLLRTECPPSFPRNPLKQVVSAAEVVEHPTPKGEFFKLGEGTLALFFNHRRGRRVRIGDPGVGGM